jgi:hypothetical protein
MTMKSRAKAKKKAKTTVRRKAATAPKATRFAAAILEAPAFVKVSADGRALPKSATEWKGVYDTRTNLIWGRHVLAGEHNYADAQKVAGQATLCGAPARAASIQERLTITDYAKHSPALDTEYFAEQSGWEWTSTLYASSPRDSAWGVSLGDGDAFWGNQSYQYHVRAVRAGQPIGL